MGDTVFCGDGPQPMGHSDIHLPEVMYYLYLPVVMQPEMPGGAIMLPHNIECLRPLVREAIRSMAHERYRYVYVSARKGWATPDNPLNRPGWHCDGFGTNDMNFVWWRGPGTRFICGKWQVTTDHLESLEEFDRFARAEPTRIF